MIDPEEFLSKGKNTPFTGWNCKGWPEMTIAEWGDRLGKRMCDSMKAQLILEDGTVFIGEGFGSHMDTMGEVVFNTGMTGYQEILSDPSYCGQIVMLTYPLIGNYGINRDDFESIHPAVKGFIVKEVTDFPSNWRSEFTLDEYFKMKKIPGIAGIDTRKLTRIIRQYGTLKGAICSIDSDPNEVVSRLRQTRLPIDQVRTVSTKNSYPSPGRGKRIVLVDFGMKHGILRELNKRGCDVVVVPYHTTAEEILQLASRRNYAIKWTWRSEGCSRSHSYD